MAVERPCSALTIPFLSFLARTGVETSLVPKLSLLRRKSLSGESLSGESLSRESLGTRLRRNHFSAFIGVPFLASFKSVGAFTGWKAIKSSLMSGGGKKELRS